VIARRVIGTAVVVMIGAVPGSVAGMAGSASAGEEALRPKVWVGRVCARARPGFATFFAGRSDGGSTGMH
jgi:hypothetical protein